MKILIILIQMIILVGCQAKKSEVSSNPILDTLIRSAENNKNTRLSNTWFAKPNYKIKTLNKMNSKKSVLITLSNRPSELRRKEYLGKIIQHKQWYIVPIFHQKDNINKQHFTVSYLIKNDTYFVHRIISW